MQNTNNSEGLTYKGREVETLSKEELLKAYYQQAHINESLWAMHEKYVQLQALTREIR